jgi:hypothetical protein
MKQGHRSYSPIRLRGIPGKILGTGGPWFSKVRAVSQALLKDLDLNNNLFYINKGKEIHFPF